MSDFTSAFTGAARAADTTVVDLKPNITVNTKENKPSTLLFCAMGFLILLIDVFFGRYLGRFTITEWFLFAFLYSILGVIGAYQLKNARQATLLSLIAYLWPLLALIPNFLPGKTIGWGIFFLLYVAHPFVLLLISDRPLFTVLWFILLIVVVYGSFMPQIQELAKVRGFNAYIPSPRAVYEYYATQAVSFVSFLANMLTRYVQGLIALSTGDYSSYQKSIAGEEEQQAKEHLGVTFERMKVNPERVYAGDGVIGSVQVTASTIDLPLDVTYSCYGLSGGLDPKKNQVDATVTPQQQHVEGSTERETVECTVDKVDEEFRAIAIAASFPFTVEVELENYLVDKQLWKRIADQPQQYGIRNTRPIASYTTGPVGVGMETTEQPVAVDPDKPTVSLPLTVSVTNQGSMPGTAEATGKGIVRHVYLVLQKPFTLTRFNALSSVRNEIAASGCATLEELYQKPVCDASTATVYDISEAVLKDYAREYTDGTFTMNMRIEAPSSRALAQRDVTTYRFQAFVSYDYTLTSQRSVFVTPTESITSSRGKSGELVI